MQTITCDMHLHSTASDGALTPSELAEECFSIGLNYVALTDHDTINGIPEFLAKAKELGMSAVSGIELNVAHEEELHILGYGFDFQNVAMQKTMQSLWAEREIRAKKIVAKLNQSGVHISFERVKELANGVIGRPHIARVLIEAGYASDITGAFQQYLEKGGQGYIPRERISKKDAIAMIRDAGGVCVLAHPGFLQTTNYRSLLKELVSYGLCGIEAFYPEHSEAQVALFEELAKEYGLFLTQGSDFHGNIRRSNPLGGEIRGNQKMQEMRKKIFRTSMTFFGKSG